MKWLGLKILMPCSFWLKRLFTIEEILKSFISQYWDCAMEFLNKLSPTNHTKFIWRVHILIANVFPLSHKSGVNFKGLYNKRISNSIEEDLKMEDQNQNSWLEDELSKGTTMLSFEFFKNFWLLQKYIADPIVWQDRWLGVSINYQLSHYVLKLHFIWINIGWNHFIYNSED